MLLPFDMDDFTTLKNASTDAVTSALSTPVFSAISLIMSAFVTVFIFFGRKFGRANLNPALRFKNEY